MQPNIIFKINKEKDFSTFKLLLDDAKNNKLIIDWAFLNKYPELGQYIKKSEGKYTANYDFVKVFINSCYFKNSKAIEKDILKYEKLWNEKKDAYFKLVRSLFGNNYWPKGEYVAYATIWGLFPRFLEEKSFQIPVIYKNKDYVPVIIAHEMLHFIFYAYFLKKYPQYTMDNDSFLIWKISEIFNSIIQNSLSWTNEFKVEAQIYPEHEVIIKKLEVKYKNLKVIKARELIRDILNESEPELKTDKSS